jgi:exodeoxyribonuclease-3
MKIISWNVNGIRAIYNKGFVATMVALNPDCLLLQETKAQSEQIMSVLAGIEGYHIYSNCAARKGYSGVTLLSRMAPLQTFNDIGIDEHDREGRILTAEFPGFFLVNVYVPNAGDGLARLPYRQMWDRKFLNFLIQLQFKKPVVVAGDFNVAHQAMDIARAKANYNKSPGYTQAEIDGFSRFLSHGFIDTYRHFHPEVIAYSWWSYRANARANNIGWRIDYVLASTSLIGNITDAFILPHIFGADHCPVGIEIDTSNLHY